MLREVGEYAIPARVSDSRALTAWPRLSTFRGFNRQIVPRTPTHLCAVVQRDVAYAERGERRSLRRPLRAGTAAGNN